MRLLAVGIPVLVLSIGTSSAHVDPFATSDVESLAQLAPADTLALIEVPSPGEIVPGLLASSTWSRFEASLAWRTVIESENWPKAMLGWKTFERIVGVQGPAAVEALAGQGLVIAVLPPAAGASQPEWLVVARSSVADVPQHILDSTSFLLRIFGWIGQGEKVHQPRLEDGTRALVVGDAFACAVDGALLAASSTDRLQEALRSLRGEGESLAEASDYREATRALGDAAIARVFIRTGRLGRETRLIPERLDQPLLSLLAGGLLEAVGRSEIVTLEAHAREGIVEVVGTVPVPPSELPGAQLASFPVQVTRRPRMVAPPGTMLTLRARRDLGQWWANRGELLDESVQRGFIEFSNVMSLLFAGRDFAREVLPDFGTDWELFVTRPAVAKGERSPSPLYPAVLLAAPILEVEAWRVPLRAAFQTAIGIVNADRAQNGLGGLLIETGEHAGTPLQWAQFVPEREVTDMLPVRYNVSPASTIVGDRLLLSSSASLLRRVMDDNRSEGQPEATPWLEVVLTSAPIVTLLSDNREALVSNAILNEGKLEEEARQDVAVLLEVIQLFERVGLSAVARKDSWQVTLQGRMR